MSASISSSKRAQRAEVRLLQPAAFGDFLLAGLALLLRRRQIDEGALVTQPFEPLRSRLEVQPQRPLDGDLPESEAVA